MKNTLTAAWLVICVFIFMNLHAQETRFFMPSEIRKAYENGTRSYDGLPGTSYWQNTVDYKIKVTVDPSEKLISGYEEAVFHNNSPDSIHTLVVRLYRDAYKTGNSRLSAIDPRDIDDGVELKEVVINGESFDLSNPIMTQRRGTNIRFRLREALKPGSELTFQASWKQKIPAYSRIRTGAYDSTTFFIAYWYPQIAVYDDIFGWDQLNYNLRTEFYNNLGNFDVEITVPEEYVVLSTGTLKNPAGVLPEEIYDRYRRARSSEEAVHIVSSHDIQSGFKTISNTWHFTASGVSDFAFAVSDHYQWDAAMQPVEDRQVFISTFHPIDTTGRYSGHVEMQQKIMQHFSDDIPGVPYPYESFTTFIARGGGGMEYPMMANNGSPSAGLTIHEMFHTYFPMYVRVNEKRWAWMDEGWATWNTAIVENRFFDDDDPAPGDIWSSLPRFSTMGTAADLPLITSSEFLTFNYGTASYSIPGTIYEILHHHLDDELFLKCYREYIRRWAKKSPTPYDFFYTFEDVSDQDLSWLWKPWFFEFGFADLAAGSFEDGRLTVVNKGTKPIPVLVEIHYKNGESEFLSRSAAIWADGRHEVQVGIPDPGNVKIISVNRLLSDTDPLNNYFPPISSLYKDKIVPDGLEGRYRIDSPSVNLFISAENGFLYLMGGSVGMPRLIYPESGSVFRSIDGDITIKFNLNDSGVCTGLDVEWTGSDLDGSLARKLE